jgi:hypothetical protein
VHIKPKAIHYNDYVDNFAKDYMYLRCIQNINAVWSCEPVQALPSDQL